MAYTPYKMKGPSLYKKLSKKQSEHIDTNKDGKISGADFPLKKRGCATCAYGKKKCTCGAAMKKRSCGKKKY
jgi:hypothetical protein|tara:strand:+ start:563 stop:778 length:216 start_codon:yes stop_codon:yes gene_type:complete